MTREMTGAEMVIQALKDQGVDTIFGYPGGAVLPIYDEIIQQEGLEHILVRHEQGAGHAAEGLRSLHWQARRRFGDVRSWRDQHGDCADRCDAGFHSALSVFPDRFQPT